MSRTRKAVLGSAFTYANFALALISGFVLFPLIIWKLGAYDNGLWLITGEMAGYLLLGDLGVFAVLPWLVAARDGAGDRDGIARHLADALAVGVVVGVGIAAVAAGIWWFDPTSLGINPADWAKVRWPLTLVLGMVAVGFPLRAFTALLGGLQDVTFVGLVALVQTALTIALTATLILLGYGMPGLAVATGVPPLIGGLAALVRVFTRYRATTTVWYRPHWRSSRHLIREGFGAWLTNLGARFLTASSGLVFALLGRPEWATVFAATAKVSQTTRPMCMVIPDSGLVGLSQVHGEGNTTRTRQLVTCLIVLYPLITGAVAGALLIGNAWFVRAWLGTNFFAGDYVSGLIAINLLLSSSVSGMFKVVAVVGFRIRIGVATLVYGALAAGLGFVLGRERGIAGLMEGTLLAGIGLAVPLGIYFLRATHGVGVRALIAGGLGRWTLFSLLWMAGAAWVGPRLATATITTLVPILIGFLAAYIMILRPVLSRAPWPDRVRHLLVRVHLIPARRLSNAAG